MVRQVHQDYNSSTGWDRIATCRTLLLLLLYTAIPPGRGKEYRELKFKCHEKEISGPLDAWPNVVHYSEYEGKALLYLTEYKTASSTGPQLVRCPEDPCFMEILADYLLRQRKKIPHSCESDLVFLVSNQPRMEQMRVCVCVCHLLSLLPSISRTTPGKLTTRGSGADTSIRYSTPTRENTCPYTP